MDSLSTFPLEAIVTVSEFLAGDNAFRTLAGVNIASKAVREATLPVLYHAVIWEDGKDYWSYDDLATPTSRHYPSAWQHVRFLFVDEFAHESLTRLIEEVDPDSSILAFFPKLQILVIKEYGNEDNLWSTPLRSCVVEVWSPVSAENLPGIQEYPLWWPEHEEGCGQPPKVCAVTDMPTSGNSVARTIIELLIAKDDLEPLPDEESSNSSLSDDMAGKSPDRRDVTYRPCACEREPFDHIAEVCFMSNGYLLQAPVGQRPSLLRQIRPDITIFAAWEADDDRIRETWLSLFSVFGCLKYFDVNPKRPVINFLFRGPSVAFLPFTLALPKLLCCNSDIYLVLQFHDRPSISNETFAEMMHRVFDQYMLKLSHITACRSTARIKQATLLAVEFPPIKRDDEYHMELESEIAWCAPASLQLRSSACREPHYKRETLAQSIGLQVWPKILLPGVADHDDQVLPPAHLRRRKGVTIPAADRLSARNA